MEPNSKQASVSPAETFDAWVTKVGHALRNLDDRSVLNSSPLAHLAYVERVAKEKYGSHILPRGLALRQILLVCVEKVATEVGNEPGLSKPCQYLQLLTKGLTCQQISKEIGRSREHVSRAYRKRAFELVTGEFLSIVNRHR